MVLSIHHVESLTHDCRWWGDFHHGNADACHQGFSLYCLATIAMCISNSTLLRTLAAVDGVSDVVTLMYQASVASKSVSKGFIRQLGCYEAGDDSL